VLPVVFGVVLIGSVDGVIVEPVVDMVELKLELVRGDVVERLRVLRRDERVVVVVDGVLMVELVDIVLSVVGDCIEPIVPVWVPIVPIVEPVPVEPPAVPPIICADAIAGSASATAANGMK
jgi:hypothetical protein